MNDLKVLLDALQRFMGMCNFQGDQVIVSKAAYDELITQAETLDVTAPWMEI